MKTALTLTLPHEIPQGPLRYVLSVFCSLYCYDFIEEGRGTQAKRIINISYGSVRTAHFDGPVIIVRQSSFFKHTGEIPEDLQRLTASAREAAFQSHTLPIDSQTAELKTDFLATSFFMLTGAADAFGKTDQYGRALAPRDKLPEGLFDLPVVNHWFRQLHELIQQLLGKTGQTLSGPHQQTILLSHDLDRMSRYQGLSGLRGVASRARSKPSGLVKDFGTFLKVNTNKQRDPYDRIESLFAVKERMQAPSTWFLLAKRDAQNADYDLNDNRLRTMLPRMKANNDEIALHGSWDSADRSIVLNTERDKLAAATGKEILGNRQHYLRGSLPDIWNSARVAKLQYDSTAAYPDYNGFRLGWSGVLPTYDFETQKMSGFYEIPLVCMDVTLANYEKIAPELALERITNLLDASCDHIRGGAFVFLWHNIIGDQSQFPGYWDSFEYFFSIASGSARFVTARQLCAEYKEICNSSLLTENG